MESRLGPIWIEINRSTIGLGGRANGEPAVALEQISVVVQKSRIVGGLGERGLVEALGLDKIAFLAARFIAIEKLMSVHAMSSASPSERCLMSI